MTEKELALDEQHELDAHDHDHDHDHDHAHDHAHEGDIPSQEEAIARLKEAILVEREELGPLRLKLTITVPRETVDEKLSEQFTELSKDAVIPGFRKGKAPRRLIEKRFAAEVGDQLKAQLISNSYMAAIEKESLKPLGDPRMWVKVKEEKVGDDGKSQTFESDQLVSVGKGLETIQLPKEGSLTYACELELKPQFELPSLDGIPVKKPNITIQDSDVDEEIRRMRLSQGRFEPVEGGSVEMHDLLYGEAKLTVDGEMLFTDDNYELFARDALHGGVLLNGFGDKVKGKKLGDTVEVDATVPDDHERLTARGKTGAFGFTIREIKRLAPHPIDDAFLSNYACETEAQLREFVKGTMEFQVDRTVREAMREQVAKHLVEHVDFTVPEGVSQRQAERLVMRTMVDMLQRGVPEAEVAKQADEMRVKAREQSLRDLKLFFILEKIAEDREIEVSEEQINMAISRIAHRTNKRFDRVRDDLGKGDGLAALYLSIRDEMVLDSVVEAANIEEIERPKTE